MSFWKKKETKEINSNEYLELKDQIRGLETEIKHLKSDLTLIENDYFSKISRLMRKKDPANNDENSTETQNINSKNPLKFI